MRKSANTFFYSHTKFLLYEKHLPKVFQHCIIDFHTYWLSAESIYQITLTRRESDDIAAARHGESLGLGCSRTGNQPLYELG